MDPYFSARFHWTGCLFELCMFVFRVHYRSSCLHWNNGGLSNVIMGWILSLVKGDDEHFGVFLLSMSNIFRRLLPGFDYDFPALRL